MRTVKVARVNADGTLSVRVISSLSPSSVKRKPAPKAKLPLSEKS